MPITDVNMRTIARETPQGPEAVTYNTQSKEEFDNLPDWAKATTTTDAVIRTIKCDNKKCDKETSFNPQDPAAIAAMPTWVRTYRMINLGNGARFGYCSDVCEVEGVTTGDHNVPEPPAVQEATLADARRAIAQLKVVEAMKTKHSKKIISTE